MLARFQEPILGQVKVPRIEEVLPSTALFEIRITYEMQNVDAKETEFKMISNTYYGSS